MSKYVPGGNMKIRFSILHLMMIMTLCFFYVILIDKFMVAWNIQPKPDKYTKFQVFLIKLAPPYE